MGGIHSRFKDYIAAMVHRGRNSQMRHTLSTNVIQQCCAALIFLFLPNFFSKADYAQVVYVSVLLSFTAFADAGISMAYGRIVPALLAQNNHDEIRLWNSTTLAFGLLASAAYSTIIALLYYVRYGQMLNTLFLLPVPFLVFWFSFYLNRANATGDFRPYWRVNSWRSVGTLTVFPLAPLCGLTGWFISTLAAALMALFSLGRQLLESFGPPHWRLIRQHLGEGLLLSSTVVLRMQLLYFARLYASLRYGATDIAVYGVMSTAYQSLSTLVISVFLPISVGLYSRYGESEEKALAFANRTVARSLMPVMAAALLAIVCAPTLFRLFFPRYHFDSTLLMTLLLSIVFYPFFLIYGWLTIAYKRSSHFLMTAAGCLGVSAFLSVLVDVRCPAHGAAWGQLLGLMVYTLLLYRIVSHGAGSQARNTWRKQLRYLAAAFLFSGVVIGAWTLSSK